MFIVYYSGEVLKGTWCYSDSPQWHHRCSSPELDVSATLFPLCPGGDSYALCDIINALRGEEKPLDQHEVNSNDEESI